MDYSTASALLEKNYAKTCRVPFMHSFLFACAPISSAPASTATSTSQPAMGATATLHPAVSTQTPVPVPTLPGLDGIPAPEEEFITAMVSENYLRVMGLARKQVQIVYREHDAASGESFVVMLDETTGVPLAFYTDQWEKSTLKFLGRQAVVKRWALNKFCSSSNTIAN